MGVRILYDDSSYKSLGQACLYCSTAGWAFGPVFMDGGRDLGHRDGRERAQAFLAWLDTYTPQPDDLNALGKVLGWRHDPRELEESGLERAFGNWLAQEAEQYAAEAETP